MQTINTTALPEQIEGLHPHSVRHRTAVALLRLGVDLSTISHFLGHASLTTTNRYAKVDQQ
jgi:site-specific recombinase XerD